MPAYAGFSSLTHFYLDSRARFEVVFMYAESARSDLNDRVCAVAVEIFVKSAFSRVVAGAEVGSGGG